MFNSATLLDLSQVSVAFFVFILLMRNSITYKLKLHHNTQSQTKTDIPFNNWLLRKKRTENYLKKKKIYIYIQCW